jgi:hypothetical protein
MIIAWILAGEEDQGITSRVFEKSKPTHPGNFGLWRNNLTAKCLDLFQVCFAVVAVDIHQTIPRLDCLAERIETSARPLGGFSQGIIHSFM